MKQTADGLFFVALMFLAFLIAVAWDAQRAAKRWPLFARRGRKDHG